MQKVRVERNKLKFHKGCCARGQKNKWQLITVSHIGVYLYDYEYYTVEVKV